MTRSKNNKNHSAQRTSSPADDERLVDDAQYKTATEKVKTWLITNAALVGYRIKPHRMYRIATNDMVPAANAIVTSINPSVEVPGAIVDYAGIAKAGRQEACNLRGTQSDAGHEGYLEQLRIVHRILRSARRETMLFFPPSSHLSELWAAQCRAAAALEAMHEMPSLPEQPIVAANTRLSDRSHMSQEGLAFQDQKPRKGTMSRR